MRKVLFTPIFNLLVLLLVSNFALAQFPTIYASVGTGSWGTSGTWETFTGNATNTPGAQGTGTAATSAPSGTHHVYVRAGHTVTMGGSKNIMGLTIESNGSLLAGGSYTLKPGNGGTGFTGPNNVTIQNDGTLGGGADVINLEIPIAAGTVNVNGNGTFLLGRIRIVGGNPNSPILNINANMSLVQTSNYALSAIYNPQATDNYTINIASGKTVNITAATGYFNNNSLGSGTGWGNYTYNINGTINLTGNTQTATNLSAFSPIGGNVTLNINGGLVTGSAFNSSPVAPGIANINVASGVTVDARLATLMNFNSNAFILANNANLQRTVNPDGAKVEFPIGTSSSSFTGVVISGSTGPAETFTATVRNTIANTPPAATLAKEWEITEATAGGNEDTLRFAWTIADEAASGFSGASPVYIARWNGSAYEYTLASVTGDGSAALPYVAKGVGFTSFGKFILTNTAGSLPVRFTGLSAIRTSNSVQVHFTNATESDVLKYYVERSVNGRDFSVFTELTARSNNGTSNTYVVSDRGFTTGYNYYRIRVVELSGQQVFSTVVKLNVNRNVAAGIQVNPNPVINGQLNLSILQAQASPYSVQLVSKTGQVVFSGTVNVAQDGNFTQVVHLPAAINKGNYYLRVSNGAKNFSEQIVIQ